MASLWFPCESSPKQVASKTDIHTEQKSKGTHWMRNLLVKKTKLGLQQKEDHVGFRRRCPLGWQAVCISSRPQRPHRHRGTKPENGKTAGARCHSCEWCCVTTRPGPRSGLKLFESVPKKPWESGCLPPIASGASGVQFVSFFCGGMVNKIRTPCLTP